MQTHMHTVRKIQFLMYQHVLHIVTTVLLRVKGAAAAWYKRYESTVMIFLVVLMLQTSVVTRLRLSRHKPAVSRFGFIFDA